MVSKDLNIWIVSDGTDSLTQSMELAKRLTKQEKLPIIQKDQMSFPESFPYLAIGVGFNVTDTLVNIKKQSGGKTKIAIILDPLKNYEDFDFIILPSYEPYKVKGNIIWTTGLINFVNDEYLANQKYEFNHHPKYKFLRDMNLKPPFLTCIIGGRHTGGNIDEEDTRKLAAKINSMVIKKGGTALISTSRRTEVQVSEILKQELKVPYFLYDYKKREYENPYGVLLSLADEIIVTGESVRMMSECCSTGKPVRIYRPKEYGFQYKPLIDELVKGNYAVEFNFETSNNRSIEVSKLDEAKRVSEMIRNSFI